MIISTCTYLPLDYARMLLYFNRMSDSSSASNSVQSVGMNQPVEFSDVYDLVCVIDDILGKYTLKDAGGYTEIRPIRSIGHLPFFPDSAFVKTSKSSPVDFIYQFEFTLDNDLFPDPYSKYGSEYFWALVNGTLKPLPIHHFIVDKSGSNSDILGDYSNTIAGLTSELVLDVQGDAEITCWGEKFSSHAETWARNMIYYAKNDFKRLWPGYLNNPLPTEDQCNAYFICTESPCHRGCCVFRLCDEKCTGADAISNTPVEGQTGAALGMLDPSLERPPICQYPDNTVKPIPTCASTKIMWPKVFDGAIDSLDAIEDNKSVNIYSPSLLYVHEWLPDSNPFVKAWRENDELWQSIAVASDTDYERNLNVAIGGSPYYHAKWIPVTMCGGGPTDVAVRLNLFKIPIGSKSSGDGNNQGGSQDGSQDGSQPDPGYSPGDPGVTTYNDQAKASSADDLIYYCFTMPTAIRMRMKGFWKPAIRKYWYDVIMHTLRYCVGYNAEGQKRGTTWDKNFHNGLEKLFNPAYAATNPDYYEKINFGDLWFEQYVAGKNGILNRPNTDTSDDPTSSGTSASSEFDKYKGGLCSTCSTQTSEQVGNYACIIADCGKEFDMPWHGGCNNASCTSSGDPNTHAFTFNIMKQITEDIKEHKTIESSVQSLTVYSMGALGAGITSHKVDYNTQNAIQLEKKLIVYSAINDATGMVYDIIGVDTDDVDYLYRVYSVNVSQTTFGTTEFPGLSWPLKPDGNPYEYSKVNVTVRGQGEIQYNIVLDENIYSSSEQEKYLIEAEAMYSSVLTVNSYSYLWLAPEFRYGTIRTSADSLDCHTKNPSFFTVSGTDGTYNIKLTPKNLLDVTEEHYSETDPSEHSNIKVTAAGYDIVLGFSCLIAPDKDIKINIQNTGKLLENTAWGIGMVGQLYSTKYDYADTNLYAQIDWYSWRDKDSPDMNVLEPLKHEYYAHYVEDYAKYSMPVYKLYSAYAKLKCRTANSSLGENEVWCPAISSSGGTIKASAYLYRNTKETVSSVSKTITSGDIELSLPNKSNSPREFYGLVKLYLQFRPAGADNRQMSALASYALASDENFKNKLMIQSGWEIYGTSPDNNTYSPQDPAEMIYSASYSAKEVNESCYDVYKNLYEKGDVELTVSISQ